MNKSLRHQQLVTIYEHLKSIGRVHTRRDFASKLGIRPEGLSSALNGSEQYLTDNLFKKIGYTFGDVFSRKWLESFEGDMLVSQSTGDITHSTVVGNNVNGNGININNNGSESEAVAILRKQLEIKDAEIQRLHEMINRLLEKI